jgi:hypothetical protein
MWCTSHNALHTPLRIMNLYMRVLIKPTEMCVSSVYLHLNIASAPWLRNSAWTCELQSVLVCMCV